MLLPTFRRAPFYAAASLLITTLGVAQSVPPSAAPAKQTYTVDQLIALTGQLQDALKSGDKGAARSLAPRIAVGILEAFSVAPKTNQDKIFDLESRISKYKSIPQLAAALKPDLAVLYLGAGNETQARFLAEEAVRELTGTQPQETPPNPLAPDALHEARLLLGTLALRTGDVATAKKALVESARFPETEAKAALGFRGPDFELAKGLLARGEREAVSEYLTLVRKWWPTGTDRVDEWSATIRGGGTPSFPKSTRGF